MGNKTAERRFCANAINAINNLPATESNNGENMKKYMLGQRIKFLGEVAKQLSEKYGLCCDIIVRFDRKGEEAEPVLRDKENYLIFVINGLAGKKKSDFNPNFETILSDIFEETSAGYVRKDGNLPISVYGKKEKNRVSLFAPERKLTVSFSKNHTYDFYFSSKERLSEIVTESEIFDIPTENLTCAELKGVNNLVVKISVSKQNKYKVKK